jgi:hypothetical protein
MNTKENSMKSRTKAKAFAMAVTALALGLAPMASAQDKGCSDATLKGAFGFKGVGVQTAPPDQAGPIATVNTLIFDGHGNVTGAGVASGGTMIPITESGTYKVKRDCTGPYEVFIPVFGAASHYFFAVVDSGNELQIICTDPGYVFTAAARRQSRVEDQREEQNSAGDSQP